MTGNRFLDTLAADDRARLSPLLRRVGVTAGAVQTEQGAEVEQVLFPIDAQLTNILLAEDGGAIEIAVVGAEGVTGLLPFLADAPSAWRTAVRQSGDAWLISAGALRAQSEQSPSLRRRLIGLGYYYQVQTSMNGACAALHPLAARVARWILTAADLSDMRDISFTQEEMASLLSVQRTSVVEAFSALKSAGAIRHLRGRITLVDRGLLTRRACGCYAALRRHGEELGIMPHEAAATPTASD
jgi:CRP-like cAMP-binding protein